MTRIAEKKVHTKALHSLSIMETRTLAMQTEHVTNTATPKGKLGIVSLVKEVYFKTTPTPVCSINISTAVLYTNCSCNGRISSAFDFADVDRERSGKISLAARLYRDNILFVCLFLMNLTGTTPHDRCIIYVR